MFNIFKKNTENKEKKKINWKKVFFVLFVAYGITFSVANGIAVENPELLKNYKLTGVFYNLFPFANPTDYDFESSMNPVTATSIGVLMVSIINIMLPLAVLLLSYKMLEVLILYVTDSESPEAVQKIISVSTLLLVTFSLSPAALIEYKVGEDGSVKITPVQYVMYSFLGEKLLKLEMASEKDFTVNYMIPEIKLGHPLAIKEDIRLFVDGYLTNDFVEEQVNLPVFEVNDTYRARFSMGNGSFIYEMPIDRTRNQKAKEYFSIDLESKERAMAQDYLNTMLQAAIIAKEFTQKIEIGGQGDTINSSTITNLFGTKKYYDQDYKNYCGTIETPLTNRMDLKTYNNYLEILTACKSDEFMTKHYTNEFYTYSQVFSTTNPYLRTGSVMLFGQDEMNQRLSSEEIDLQIPKICSADSGFFSCSEAISFAAKRHETTKIKIGFLTRPARALNDLFSNTFNSGTVASAEQRIFEKAYITNAEADFGNSVLDYITGTESEPLTPAFTITGKAIGESYKAYVFGAELSSFDLSNVKVPTTVDELTQVAVGTTIGTGMQRFLTCLKNPEVVTDNFRCRSATLELLDIAKELWITGLKIKIYDSLSKPIFTSKATGVSSSNTTPPVIETFTSKLIRYPALASLSYGFNNGAIFKENPYSLGYTAEALAATRAMTRSMGGALPDVILNAATKMMMIGAALFTVVFAPIIFFVYRFIEKLFEIIVEIIIMPLSMVVFAYKQGEIGAMTLFKEFVVDIGILVVYAIVPYVVLAFYDMKISFFIREILFQVDKTFESLNAMIMNSALLLLYIFIFSWMLMASHKKMSEMIKDKLEKDIKNI